MDAKVVCSSCGCPTIANDSNLIRSDVYDVDGKYYKIIYFRCKCCGKNVIVQVDDADTLNTFRELKKLMTKVIKKKIKGETVSPKDIRKRDKLTKELREKRASLNEECNCKVFYNDSGDMVAKYFNN